MRALARHDGRSADSLLPAVLVGVADILHVADHLHLAVIQPQSLVAHTPHLFGAMRNEQQGSAVIVNQFADAFLAFLLEHEVAHRKRFVHH